MTTLIPDLLPEHAADTGSHTCEAISPWLGVCGQPGARPFRRLCVHEHMDDGWLCQEHVDAVDFGLCAPCDDLGHDCPITLIPLTGGAS